MVISNITTTTPSLADNTLPTPVTNNNLATTNSNFTDTTFTESINQIISSVLTILIAQVQQLIDDLPTQNTNANQTNAEGISQVVPFNTAIENTEPGPIQPGQTLEIDFTAQPGENISFATMFAPTNDAFFSPNETGIAVYDDFGNPITGDVSNQLGLWDAGTEFNEAFSQGQFQTMDSNGQMIADPNTGAADPNNQIRRIDQTNAFSTDFPAASELMQAEIVHNGNDSFTLRLTNTSGDTNLAAPNSPGVLVVHDNTVHPLFDQGETDRGLGLEGVAEDGNPAALIQSLNELTGLNTAVDDGH